MFMKHISNIFLFLRLGSNIDETTECKDNTKRTTAVTLC